MVEEQTYNSYLPEGEEPDSRGRTLGLLGLLSAVLAFFVPVFFGPIGVLLGARAREQGARRLGTVALIGSLLLMATGFLFALWFDTFTGEGIVRLQERLLPMVILFLFAVVFPAIFWFFYFRREDRTEPESKKTLIKYVAYGVAVPIIAAVLEHFGLGALLADEERALLGADMAGMFQAGALIGLLLLTSAAFVEEIVKFLVLRGFLSGERELNQIRDGAFFGGMIGIGFSLVENSLYFFDLAEETMGMFLIGVAARGVFTTLMHITSAGLIGYALARRKFFPRENGRVVTRYFLGALLLHLAYNASLSLPVFAGAGVLFAFGITVTAFFFLLGRIRRDESRLVYVPVAGGDSGGRSGIIKGADNFKRPHPGDTL